MPTIASHIRKAAILVRSLDGTTTEQLLAQLSPYERSAVEDALQTLGEVDEDEQADVLAEFRLAGSAAGKQFVGVELADSLLRHETTVPHQPAAPTAELPTGGSFSFLHDADPRELAPFLGRQHAQTVAVVLSQLDAQRAGEVFAVLPLPMQTEVVERLAALGSTDQESLSIIEDELATWFRRQPKSVGQAAAYGDHAARLLAAVKPEMRRGLLSQLRARNSRLAIILDDCFNPLASQPAAADETPDPTHTGNAVSQSGADRASENTTEDATTGVCADASHASRCGTSQTSHLSHSVNSTEPVRPAIAFAELAELDPPTLRAVLRAVDPQVLRLALAGAGEPLIDRVSSIMPARVARQFRDQLHQLGPTRLSDVARAQQALSEVAAEIIANSRWRARANAPAPATSGT